jgi:putative ABC transport system permease protein
VSVVARRTLVVGEVALATVTLFGAGLALRSFGAVLSQPLGFESSGRLTATVLLPGRRYATADAQRVFMTSLEDRLAALPGVTSVGATNILPLTGSDARRGVAIEGRDSIAGEPPTRMHPRSVTTEYLQTMHVPILRGRGFTKNDDEHGQPVVIVNETAAKRFWPGADPIGRRIQFSAAEPWLTIVGIAGDVKDWGLNRPVNPMAYLPFSQRVQPAMTFVLAGAGDPTALIGPVRAAVKQADADLPVTDVATLDRVVEDSVRSQRAQATLLTAFGTVALALSAIGIFGVLAHLVSSRTYEIGMRMTLGARPVTILGRLVAETVAETGVGLTMGLLAGVALMRVERDVLFNVEPWDSVTLAAVAGALLLAAVGAALIPGRRAMLIDPVRALRGE